MILLTLMFTGLLMGCHGKMPFFFRSDETDITRSLNKSIDPCNNFYQYSCGEWIKKNTQPNSYPFWNPWQQVHHKVLGRLETILNANEATPNYLEKARTMFKTCMHRGNSNSKYVHDLKVLINNFYGWPIVNQFWNESHYDWSMHVAKVTRILGIHPIIKMHVFIDVYNTSQYMLYIEHGDVNLPHTILANPIQYTNYIDLYKIWVFKTIRNLYPNCKHLNTSEIEEMIDFEVQLAQLSSYKEKIEKIQAGKLGNKFPLKWIDVFGRLFYGLTTTVTSDSMVLLRAQNYLNDLLLLLSVTETRTIANYISWSVVRNLLPDTSEQMRQLSFVMDRKIYGLNHNTPLAYDCMNKVNTYMDAALISKYTKRYVHSDTLDDVRTMTKNIKSEFIRTLKSNSWLGDVTKRLVIEKVRALKYVVGYPEWLNNDTFLENKYEKLKITNNHFLNMLRARMFKSKNHFVKLNKPTTTEWPGSVFEVNAYYSLLQNFIFIPLGMLERPFYSRNSSQASNYGALGSLIGHEISHALDVIGRHTDKNGNLINWWSHKDKSKYDEVAKCFKQQYNNYNINGANTLAENIADNVGLKLSYDSYRNLNESSKLNEPSVNQLFFISFAQVWCEISSENQFIDEEDHAPVKHRVLGVTENSNEFDQAFSCLKNNTNICSLW